MKLPRLLLIVMVGWMGIAPGGFCNVDMDAPRGGVSTP
jgi:hypothetical protein